MCGDTPKSVPNSPETGAAGYAGEAEQPCVLSTEERKFMVRTEPKLRLVVPATKGSNMHRFGLTLFVLIATESSHKTAYLVVARDLSFLLAKKLLKFIGSSELLLPMSAI